ncbi:hypothetical protein H0E87_009156 [Populus deltoides]|uniref:UBC core domain-containing protein n=1 Tax=Populus deltoides TaxID=3696 RepID=A0A8T2Z3K1_POPDE|nr:hypothetical protein H0E87_009156 [Populus deltoides]
MDMLPNDSDWESFSGNYSSSEDIEELDSLYCGRASSILSSLEESIGKIDDFLSFERGFIHGDVVCSATDPSAQMGRVVDVNMLVNLESSHGRIIKDVDSKKLLKIRSISVGDYVVHGPWIGRVDEVIESVTVIFDDGTSCEVAAVDQEKLSPISPNILEDSMHPYYPGQRVQIRLSALSKSATWLCGAWNENQDVGTVSAVKAGLVYVDWLACALVGSDLSLPAPQRLQDAKKLNLLSCFLHENWQLGDWCMLPLADCTGGKERILFDASIIEIIEKDRKRGQGFTGLNPSPIFQDIFVIVKTKTIVNVVWQDGSCSQGLDSKSLLPVNIVNSHDFWPGQFVLDKGACEDPYVSGNQKWGFVNCVDAKEQIVKVKWKSFGVNQADIVGSDQIEETVSAYELVEHPEYSFSYGDIVFKNLDQANKNHLNRDTGMGADAALEGSDHGKDQVDYLSCIGCVTGFEDGDVEVTWASSLKTKVSPNHIFRIDRCEVSAETIMQHEQREEEVNKETVDHDEQFSILKGKEATCMSSLGLWTSEMAYAKSRVSVLRHVSAVTILDSLNSISSGNENAKCPWESSSFSLPEFTLGFFSRITEGIFGSFGCKSVSGPISSDSISEDGNRSKTPEEKEKLETCDLCMELQPLVAGDILRFEGTNLKPEANDDKESKEHRSSSASNSSEQFKRFDMVVDCSDHHFLDGEGNALALSQVKRGWLKKVQQEWSILEKNLPESIYVRVYEDRMDLLRAAIVGSNGTPYHDGLFFFDIFLPPEYPQEPPHFEALVEEHLSERSQNILSSCKSYLEGAPVAYAPDNGKTRHANQKGASTGFKIMLGKLFSKLVEAFSENCLRQMSSCRRIMQPVLFAEKNRLQNTVLPNAADIQANLFTFVTFENCTN